MIFLNHVVLNNPSKETVSAGLGPVEQYGFILITLIIIGIIILFKRKKKSK